MRVGDILLRDRWIDDETLAMELFEQPSTGMRICSLLVKRGLVTFDQASRALGEQLGVAAVLRHHLHGRDPAVATLIPEAVARARVVLPIGRLDSGALIVCARDPSPALQAEMSRYAGNVVIAVAPAAYLERAIVQTFDVEIPIDIEMPVKKTAVPAAIKAHGKRDAFDTMLASLADIDDWPWLLEVVSGYFVTKWSAWLLMEVRDGRRAVGMHGHGAKLSPRTTRTLVLDLDETNLLAAAYRERRVVDEPPGELAADDAALIAAIGTTPVVAAIVTNDAVGYFLIVGEPKGDRDDAVVDLGLLADALGEALARLR